MARLVVLALSTAFAVASASARQTRIEYDVILRGGTIHDGTGRRSYVADVAVAGGRIALVGDLSRARAAVDLDVRGLVVAPGFINIHSHPIQDGLSSAANMLTQGVTTEIVNADGGGPLEIGRQLAEAESAGLAVNAGAYIGFNSAWTTVMGAGNRPPAAEEVARMRELLLAGLRQGAWGVSSGLDYKPAYFASAEDVVRVVSVAAPWRTNFTNHDRLTPESRFSSRAGIAETMAIGARAGLVPVVTHMKAQGVEQGSAPAILSMMQTGRYTAADAYPYLAGQSGLGALIVPGWAQDGGRAAMLERFADPALRARIAAEAEEAMTARFGGPEGVYVTTIGRELTDVMRELGVPAGEAVLRLLESRDMGAILRFGAEPDLIAILRHPATSVACDCGATPGIASHPRYYGAFPRVLGRYVRETRALSWEDAIRKMTGLPAATIGMVDRGLLAAGMAADVAVFDPTRIVDRATFEQPTLPSEGMRHVLVNGRLALRNGIVTGERAGRALRRTAGMPSRPLLAADGRVRVSGRVAGSSVSIDVRQSARDRAARGSFRVGLGASGTTIAAAELGILQRSDRWASFTARARWSPSGVERSVVVLLDEADPDTPGGTRVIVESEGEIALDGRLDRP
jgi:N-acyl-D-aspartate/D-glutamate deacylase